MLFLLAQLNFGYASNSFTQYNASILIYQHDVPPFFYDFLNALCGFLNYDQKMLVSYFSSQSCALFGGHPAIQ